MARNEVPLDQPVTLDFYTFSDDAETVPADATTVTIDILLPDGTTTTYTLADQVTHASTGHYQVVSYLPPTSGDYGFHWKSTGTATSAADGYFRVKAKYVRTVNLDPTDLATYLGVSIDTTRMTALIESAIELCESVVSPLPPGAESVVKDVAARAYGNPGNMQHVPSSPFPINQGAVSGALWLTRSNKATLRRLAGRGGAFSIDMLPADAGQNLPPWDTGQVPSTDAGWSGYLLP